MILRYHFLEQYAELKKLEQSAEDKVDIPFWKNCKEGEPQYSLAEDEGCIPCMIDTKEKIHLVTNLFPMSVVKQGVKVQPKGPVWGFIEEWDKINDEEVYSQRDRELLDVLQMNLNNNLIAAVHILFNNDQVVEHVMNQRLRFACKIVFHRVKGDPTYKQALQYIGKYLRHRIVIFTNQDVYLGEGWEQINFDRMRKEKIMYALTRHGKKERYCTMPDSCSRLTEYMGSHDAFAFVLIREPKEHELREIDEKNDQFGIENIMITIFRKYLRYEVINPCFVLYVYHVHCANVHSKRRQRIGKYNNTGHAYFIDQLYTTA